MFLKLEMRSGSFAALVQRLLGCWALFCFRRSLWTLIGFAGVVSVAAAGATRVKLDPDITQLLPASYQSVRDVEALRDRFGGIGYVAVVVSGGTQETRRAFADRVTPDLERLPDVRYATSRIPVEFFRDRGLYFLELADLETMRDQLEARKRYQIQREFLDLDDEPPPPVDFSQIRRKQEAKIQRLGGNSEQASGYYEDASRLLILARPTEFASDLEFCRRVVSDVETVVERSRAQFSDELGIEIAGRYKKRVDLQATLGRDLAWTSSAALLLVLGYVVFHFRRLAATILVMAPLLLGTGLAYGFAGFSFGTLNVLTAAIGAILLGTGIDNGIHMLGRYYEARGSGLSPERAVTEGLCEAGRASVAAALTTSVAFACLALSEFRAFREFGILAAVGTLLVLFVYITLLPALLGLAVRYAPSAALGHHAGRLPGVRSAMRYPGRLVFALALLTVAFFAAAPALRFDADFAALDRTNAASFRLDPTINQLVGRSQTPLVFLARNQTEALETAAVLRSKVSELGERATIGLVATLQDLVPEDQATKKLVLEQIRKVLSRIDTTRLPAEERDRVVTLTRMAEAEPFTVTDLPGTVRKQFEPRTGSTGPAHFVLAYPTVSMSDATTVRRLARQLRNVELQGGVKISAAGEPMIMADILEIVARDAPRIVLLTGLLILVVLRSLLGSTRQALLSLVPAVLTLGVTAGVLSVFRIDLNYLNMIMLPILLGISVDDGMHIVTRLAAGEPLERVWSHTGWNILGAIVTDIFGFGVLAFASHPGLASLGKVAVVGLGVNLVACVLFLPAMLALSARVVRVQGPC